ncbi:Colicin-D [Serratia entomophila]|uniref:S-type pyocin domain-containing protein n=1 Tax=Serratia entomophila TaxID=42906 RepID=UPI00217CB47E|nr:S-type pyocin domain-containing protein [Serratia entomophila]CAI1809374.1 Colicin-D [Serratia entomophila]CAI1847067.1 Colicin-D [Serratia entomophila]CAI1931402.1 Colicin-D [Serratia entomophila]CAI2094678.1 Colicin-D [Serratia entomophila]
MTDIAYYKDGVAYTADGQPIIIITGPQKQPGAAGGGDGGGGLAPENQTPSQKESSALTHTTAKMSQLFYEQQKAFYEKQVAETAASRATEKAARDALTAQLNRVSDLQLKTIQEKDKNKLQAVHDQAQRDLEILARQVGAAKTLKKAQEAAEQAAIEAQRKENELKAAEEAQARAKAEMDAAEKAMAEDARRAEDARKAEEARRAEEARKVEAARKALFGRAGILDAPGYTPDMIKAANAALATAGVMVLNRAGGMVQLSTWVNSVMTTTSELAGWVSGAVWRGTVAVSRIATVSAVGPAVGALVAGFWPGKAGEGSDRVPGRDIEMFAAQVQLFAAGKISIAPEMTTVDLPVRGFIRRGNNGQQEVILVKTGTGGVSASVPVYRPVRDEKTGLDQITLPAVAGAPGRTILINPGTAPSGPWHTGNPAHAAPVTPVHTGTEIKQADSIVTTTFPAGDLPLQDFIYWQPDATGTGVEAIYVMLSSPRDMPGKVSGKGQQVGEGWLNKAGQELGSPVPSQVADKLRGREFANFDAFRKAFWQEVSKDPALSKQFIVSNRSRMAVGKAPKARKLDAAGKRTSFEIHHINEISKGGDVYNIDNLRVMTPKRHVDIHKGGK